MAGLWGVVAPYSGPLLGLTVDVPAGLEVADHVVPGLPVTVLACYFLMIGRIVFLPALMAVLPGLWMVVTHVSLLGSAVDGEVSWPAALNMFVPSIAILLLTVGCVALAWHEDEARES